MRLIIKKCFLAYMYAVIIIIHVSTCTWITQQQNFWIDIDFYVLYMTSDRVCKKKFKLCVILEAIVRDKKLIVQDILWDCTILCQTKRLVSHTLSKQTLNSSSRTFSFTMIIDNIVKFLL